MVIIYKKLWTTINRYNYFWILDIKYNFHYFYNAIYYMLLNNNNIYIKNNIYCVKYINLNKINILKFINYKIFENNLKNNIISLKFVGLGYKIIYITNKIMMVYIGHSHNLYINIPNNIQYRLENEGKGLILESHDKILLTTIAARLKNLKKEDPYKGSGIRFYSDIFIPKSYKK